MVLQQLIMAMTQMVARAVSFKKFWFYRICIICYADINEYQYMEARHSIAHLLKQVSWIVDVINRVQHSFSLSSFAPSQRHGCRESRQVRLPGSFRPLSGTMRSMCGTFES